MHSACVLCASALCVGVCLCCAVHVCVPPLRICIACCAFVSGLNICVYFTTASIRLSVCAGIHLFAFLFSVHAFVCLCVHPFICVPLSARASARLHPIVWVYVCSSARVSVSARLGVRPSVCVCESGHLGC